jgi:hypothetical protein
MKIEKKVLVSDRVRSIEGSFSFIPHKFITKGFLSVLSQHELLVYIILVLVGDRFGLSYYSQDRLCTMLKMTIDDFIHARNGLIQKSLIDFDGFMFQVLSLPSHPVTTVSKPLSTEQDFLTNDPLTIRQYIEQQLSKPETREDNEN